MIGEDFQLHLSAVTVQRRRSPRSVRRNDLSVVRVDFRVWEAALRIADGDAMRIEVISTTEVIIHNTTRRNK